MDETRDVVARAGRAVLTVAVVLVVLHAGFGLLPPEPLLGVLTSLRLVVLAGLLAGAAAVLAGPGSARLVRTRLDLPIVLVLGAGLLATVVSGAGRPGLRDLLTVAGAFYLVVLDLRLRDRPGSGRPGPPRPGWPGIGSVVCLAVAAAGGLALAQAAQGVPTGFCRSTRFGDAPCDADALVRAVGTFANPNLLAAFVVLLGPPALAHVLGGAGERSDDRSADRIAGGALVAVGYGGLVVTFSRAGYVAALVGLLALLAWWPRRGGAPSRWRLALGAGAAVVAGAGLVLASWAGGTLGVRQQIWSAAVRVGQEHPAGVGLGRAGAVLDAATPSGVPVVHAHNLWLNWFVEAGVPGLVAVSVLMSAAVLVTGGGVARGDRRAAAALAGLTGFLLVSLLDDPANLTRIWLAVWVVMAVGAASAPPTWRRARGHAHRAEETVVLPPRRHAVVAR
jgi:hypothetical protein